MSDEIDDAVNERAIQDGIAKARAQALAAWLPQIEGAAQSFLAAMRRGEFGDLARFVEVEILSDGRVCVRLLDSHGFAISMVLADVDDDQLVVREVRP